MISEKTVFYYPFLILTIVYFFAFSIFDICYLRIGAFIQLALILFLVIYFATTQKELRQKTISLLERTLIWSIISYIILSMILLMIYLIFPEESIGVYISLALISLIYTTIVSISICFQRRIINKDFLSDSKERIKYRVSQSLILILGGVIFFSPVLLFIFYYALVYGKNYGFTLIEFFIMMKINIFSFIPLLGLAFFRKTRLPLLKHASLKKFKRILFLLASVFLIVISSLIYPLIRDFRTTTNLKYTTFDFFLFYVIAIGVLMNIIFLFRILRTSQFTELVLSY